MFIADVGWVFGRIGASAGNRGRQAVVFLTYRSLLVDGKDAVELMAYGEHACVA